MRRMGLMGCALTLLAGVAWAEIGSAGRPIGDVTVTTTATKIADANPYRTALSCTNNDSSTHVRWGSALVTPTTGQRLPATASVEIPNTMAVYMAAESNSVTVSCTEETIR